MFAGAILGQVNYCSRGDSPTLSHQQMVPEASLPIGVYEIDKANGFQDKWLVKIQAAGLSNSSLLCSRSGRSHCRAYQNALIGIHRHIKNVRCQCYDDASSMNGEKTGVATQIKALNSKCLYTHCAERCCN